MSGHVGGLDSSLDLGALADVLVTSTTPAIQDRLNDLSKNAELLEAARHVGSSASTHTNNRVSRKSQKAMDVQSLHRLWKDEGRETDELRRVLKSTNERLAAEREQSLQLEQRLKDVRMREAGARMARKRAESDAAKAAAEARAYKLHLEMLNLENSKAQEAVNTLAVERREAEAAAARARATAQKLREKLVRERALHEGRTQGINEGMRIGYDEGLVDGHDEGFGEMRKRAFAVWEHALNTGAINPNADFDLDKAIRAQRARAPAIADRGPSRHTSLRGSLNRYPSINGHARTRSNPNPYHAQITSSEDLSSPSPPTSPRRVPVPQFAPGRPPVISEVPITQPQTVLVTVTSPPESNLPRSIRSPSPQPVPFPNLSTTNLGHHVPVEPMYEGMVPTADENGRIPLPAPHDINPSPSTRSVPLPATAPSGGPPSGARTPRNRRSSLTTTQGHDMRDEADREPGPSRPSSRQTVRREELAAQAQRVHEAKLETERAEVDRQRRALEEERHRFQTQLEQERAMHAADLKMREEQEEARERQRKLEREAELARDAERELERSKELERGKLKERELELERARAAEQIAEGQRLQAEVGRARRELEAAEHQRNIEREAERKAALEREIQRKAAEEAAARQREIEREAAERLAAERIKQELEAAERLARERAMHERVSAEMEANRKVEAARAEAEQIAARERFQVEQVAALTQQLQQQQQERDLPAPPLSVRNGASAEDSDYDDDDPTTDDAVPYDASGQRQHPGRRKNGRGSVYSAKTARTGMSTPLSQFTILEDAEAQAGLKGKTSAQRKQAMARHRDTTLARERQRENTAGGNEAPTSRAPYMPVIPETASQTNGEAEKLVPRTPHSSLPALPVKLDKVYPPPMGPASPRTMGANDLPGVTEHSQPFDSWGAANDFGFTDDAEKIINSIPRNKPNRTVVPVPAPSVPIYMGGTPKTQNRGTHRNPYAQSIEQYDEMRSPSPTPSHRVGKPVSPIPTILVERPSDEGIQTTAKAGRMNAAPGRNQPRSILKNNKNTSQNSHNPHDQSTSSPSIRASQPIIPIMPNGSSWTTPSDTVVPPAQPPVGSQPSNSIRMAPKSPYYPAAETAAKDDSLPSAPTRPPRRTDSPASSGVVPVMGDNLPEYKGPLPMARPGYTIPPQKTDVELFGAPERPAGWTIGPPNNVVNDASGSHTHPTTIAPAIVPAPQHKSPIVSQVALNQGADPAAFAFGSASGPSGPIHLPSQTPRKLARPIGSQSTNFEPQPGKTPKTPFAPMTPRMQRPVGAPAAELEEIPQPGKTPKTPFAPMTPRMQRPVGAPTAEPEEMAHPGKTPKTPFAPMTPRMQRPLGAPTAEPEIAPSITPAVPPVHPITPRMQRPAGAPTGPPEFGALPPEDLAAIPATQSKPPMRRPGMASWDAVPKVDTFHMMGGPASQSHHFSTPGPAHRPLPGHQPVVQPTVANTPDPVIPNFGGSVQQGQGWRTGPMPVMTLPPSSPGQTQALMNEAVDVWGRQPNFQKPTTPKVNPPSPSPIVPIIPPTAAFEAPATEEPESSFEPPSSSANKKTNKKARAKAKKAATKGKTVPGGPSNLVRASQEDNSSPNSKPVGIPSLTFTAPSPSVSPAPPNDHTVAPLVRPVSDGAGGSTRSITHIAGPFVTPPSPSKTNKSQKPMVEEVTDEDAPRRTPMHASARKLRPSSPLANAWDNWGED